MMYILRSWNKRPKSKPEKMVKGDNVDRVTYIPNNKRLEAIMRSGDINALNLLKKNVYDVAAENDVDIDEIGLHPFNVRNLDHCDVRMLLRQGNKALIRLQEIVKEKKEKDEQDTQEPAVEPPEKPEDASE